jgi:alginate O-acetyltransferase complex protein AlgI
MSFNSLPFLAFLTLIVVAYWLLPRRFRWVLLLLASYFFCATWAPTFLIWLILSTLVAYTLARLMRGTSDTNKRKILLAFGVVSNVSLHFILKYLAFGAETLQTLFGYLDLTFQVTVPNLLLPVGISFYTLQSISYLIDVYRGKIEPETHVGLFALYMAFFPKLVSGPIERAGHLIPQFRQTHTFDASSLFNGLQLVLWGMFKKVVIADRLAVYVNEVYGDPGGYAGWTIVIAVLFSAVHIYSDFSGYSDIAIGVARLFDFEIIQNFNQPYLAPSITEFWRRWHISFSSWLRDYLYIPLGGNRVSPWRQDLNLLFVFLASALWHGATWTFVCWGALHGIYLVLEKRSKNTLDRIASKLHLEDTAVRRIMGTVTTVLLVSFAWIFFYAPSLPDAMLLIRNLFRFGSGSDIYAPWAGLMNAAVAEMALAWGLIGLLVITQLGRSGWLPRISLVTSKTSVRWAAYLFLALALMNLGVATEFPFIYAGF